MKRRGTRTIFIDRDGVINKDPGGWTTYNYVTEWKDFHFLPGSLEALKLLNAAGIDVIIVSNQAGVSKRYFSKEALDELNSRMCEEIGKKGGRIKEVYYCIHRDEDNCSCRKPNTGMFETAAKKHGLDLRDVYFIGDSLADITAGSRIGARTIFVLSGKTSLDQMKRWHEKPDYIFKDLLEAVRWLLNKEKRKSERARKREKEGAG